MAEEICWRKCDVLRGDKWERVEFEEIKCGERFRLFNVDGTLDWEGTAATAPVPCDPPGNWQIISDKNVDAKV